MADTDSWDCRHQSGAEVDVELTEHVRPWGRGEPDQDMAGANAGRGSADRDWLLDVRRLTVRGTRRRGRPEHSNEQDPGEN